jgi:hypothetical protein
MYTEFEPECALVDTTVTVFALTEVSTVHAAPSIVPLSNPSQNVAPAGHAPPSPEVAPDPLPPSSPPPPLPLSFMLITAPLELDPLATPLPVPPEELLDPSPMAPLLLLPLVSTPPLLLDEPLGRT